MRSPICVLLPSVLVLLSGCYVRPAEGAFPCTTAADCPGGWVCRADMLCWSTDDTACPSGLHFERSVAACREDLDAPVIHVSPATPRTLDDLSVVIDTPTVETMRPGAGPITYRYAWSRDGAPVTGETTEVIDAALTTRDQVWRVEVTPLTDDGLVGPMATAMVTIANTPPVLRTVGLSSYWPVEGEALTAAPGSTSDVDGDSVTVRYSWTADGAPLVAPGAGLIPGPTEVGRGVSVQAWAFDGTDEGSQVSAGPVVILADATRWIPLLPSLTNAAVMYDEPNERFVGYSAGMAWEAYPDTSGITVRPLSTHGPGVPDSVRPGAQLIRDEINDRMLFLSGDEPGVLYALSLAERGHETWTRTAVAGTGPLPEAHLRGSDCDVATQTIWVFGGFVDTDPDIVVDELWSLDVEVVGGETWHRHEISGSAPPGLAGPVLSVIGANHLFVAGGFIDGGVVQASAYEITVDTTGAAHGSLARVQLPAPRFLSQAVRRGNLLAVMGGVTNFADVFVAAPTVILDIEHGLIASESAAPPELVSIAPGCGACVDAVFLGSNGSDTLNSGTVDPVGVLTVSRTRHVAAPHVGGSARMIARDFTLIGGSDDACDAPPGLAIDALQWRTLATTVDPVDSSSPATCARVRSSESNGGLFLLDGSTSPEAYSLDNRGQWAHRLYASGANILSGADGAAVGNGSCRRGYAVGGPGGDLATLDCVGSDSDCSWRVQPGLVGSRAWTTAATVRAIGFEAVLVHGGADSIGRPLADLLSIDLCSNPPSVAPMPVTGTAPVGRSGHSFTPVTGDDGSGPRSVYVFGGNGAADELFNDAAELVVMSDHEARWEPVVLADEVRPAPRTLHAAAWEPFTHRLLVFGGRTADEDLGDLWELRIR